MSDAAIKLCSPRVRQPPPVGSTPVATVTDIDIDRERSVTVRYDDGRACTFGLEELRQACPCATCRSLRDRGEAAWPRPGPPLTLRIEEAELVGAWGLSVTWNDGHATGIYPWDALRRWCDEAG
jgi:DUF971 family protein